MYYLSRCRLMASISFHSSPPVKTDRTPVFIHNIFFYIFPLSIFYPYPNHSSFIESGISIFTIIRSRESEPSHANPFSQGLHFNAEGDKRRLYSDNRSDTHEQSVRFLAEGKKIVHEKEWKDLKTF